MTVLTITEDNFNDIVFGKIDTDVEQALANAFGIRSVPTLMIIREQTLGLIERAFADHHVISLLGRPHLSGGGLAAKNGTQDHQAQGCHVHRSIHRLRPATPQGRDALPA